MNLDTLAEDIIKNGPKSAAELAATGLNSSQVALVGAKILSRHELVTGRDMDDMAEVLHIGISYLQKARRVFTQDKGGQLMAAVVSGCMNISEAAELLSGTDEQRQTRLKNLKPISKFVVAASRGTKRDLAAKEPTAKEPTAKDTKPVKPQADIVANLGVIYANEAINSLIRIPKNDPSRKRGFQIVSDWIKGNP